MNILRPLALCAAVTAITAFSGCGTAYDTDNHGKSVQLEPSHNFFGIVKTSPGSFIPVENNSTVRLSSDEIYAGRDISGNNVSLFWGALTFTDY
ncbi:MAG: hypothetical protein LBV12_11010 [Puniceicoccales bacterium]|jgi:hypothetical protein|nr:hypothetical protein [Puniceicoccales bacterium]